MNKIFNFFSEIFSRCKSKLKANQFLAKYNLHRFIIHRYFVGMVAMVGLNILIIILMSHKTPAVLTLQSQQLTMERSNLAALGENLNDVSIKLAAIEATLKSTPSHQAMNVHALATEIANIRVAINSATAASQNALAHEILLSSDALQGQLSTIQHQLTALQTHAATTHFLSASTLPFTILHIDTIQGNAVVTVSYNHTDFPLMIGDSLVGFMLSQADFAKQTAIFVNAQQQHVLVRLSVYLPQAGNVYG